MKLITKHLLKSIVEATDPIGDYYMSLEGHDRLGYCVTFLDHEGGIYLQCPRFFEKWSSVKKYDEYAADKGRLSLANKCSTLKVTQNPIGLSHKDIIYPGGIFLKKFVHIKAIGVSGFKGVRDHAFGMIIKNMLKAEARVEFSQWNKDNPEQAYLI